jgi:hypothetical protein
VCRRSEIAPGYLASMRRSQRRQNPPAHGRAQRYGAFNDRESSHDDEATAERSRLENRADEVIE